MSRPKRTGYVVSFPKSSEHFTPEQLDFLRRRTVPFLDRWTHYSLEHLMQEAYLQGLRDAVTVMESA